LTTPHYKKVVAVDYLGHVQNINTLEIKHLLSEYKLPKNYKRSIYDTITKTWCNVAVSGAARFK